MNVTHGRERFGVISNTTRTSDESQRGDENVRDATENGNSELGHHTNDSNCVTSTELNRM